MAVKRIMETRSVMEIALKAGEILLTSGAEIYRVEDTVRRICRCYGVDCESFVLPTGIFLSTTGNAPESISFVKRIHGMAVNLHRIELINAFSWHLQEHPMAYGEAIQVLESIEKVGSWSFSMHLIASGVAAFAFTLLFAGSFYDGMIAMGISMFIYLIKVKISQIGFFQFFQYFISGVLAGGIGLFAVELFPPLRLNLYKIIIGSLMIQLPGIGITNGVKDALYGDISSSLSRLGEAVFITAAMGTGVGLAIAIGMR
jgi:uncharacterized membrane protein YjjP (DUF1212 family)